MYILFVYHSMLFALCVSVIEMNDFDAIVKSDYREFSDYQPLLVINNSSNNPTKGKKLWDECEDDIECFTHINNSECQNSICQCRHGFSDSKNKDDNNHDNKPLKACYPIDKNVKGKLEEETTDPTSPPKKSDGTHMLPIMIVLGVMFIGMCVALNLFSRAQFRNSRSLFSTNSHIVKTSTRSSSNRRTSSSHNSIPAALVSQHRVNSTGSGSLGSDSPLKTTIGANRAIDNRICTTTKLNVKPMDTNVVNNMKTADVTLSQANISSSIQL